MLKIKKRQNKLKMAEQITQHQQSHQVFDGKEIHKNSFIQYSSKYMTNAPIEQSKTWHEDETARRQRNCIAYIENLKTALRTRIDAVETQLTKLSTRSEITIDNGASRKHLKTKTNLSLYQLDQTVINVSKQMKTRLNNALEDFDRKNSTQIVECPQTKSKHRVSFSEPVDSITKYLIDVPKENFQPLNDPTVLPALLVTNDRAEIVTNPKLIENSTVKLEKNIAEKRNESFLESEVKLEGKMIPTPILVPTRKASNKPRDVAKIVYPIVPSTEKRKLKGTERVSAHFHVLGILVSLFLVGTCILILQTFKCFFKTIWRCLSWVFDFNQGIEASELLLNAEKSDENTTVPHEKSQLENSEPRFEIQI